jgi:hypothetical protein
MLEKNKLNFSIAICSIVRNCENQLSKNINLIENLRKYFKSSFVIIYENDSVDNTKNVLLDWQKKSNNVNLYFETLNVKTIPVNDTLGYNRFFSKERITKMAYFRNKYLIELDNLNLDFDFVIVVDLDVIKIDLNGILNSFKSSHQWDVVTANGYSTSPSLKRRYHDSYALVEIGKENDIQTEKCIKNNQLLWSFLKIGQPLIPVYSAYGGLAIYKYNFLKGLRYGVFLNNDRRVESRGEHFYLHDHIIKSHNARIFINPNMVIKYQKINFHLILSYFKNLFKNF